MERITPSKHNPWVRGLTTGINGTQRLKAEAMAAKIVGNRARYGLPEVYGHTITLEPRAGDNYVPRYARIVCPVIACTRDRQKLLVIAPDGTDQWVPWR